MKKIVNKVTALLVASFMVVFWLPSLTSAQSTTTTPGNENATSSVTTTPDNSNSTTSTSTEGTINQTPAGGVRAGSGGTSGLGSGLLALGIIAAGTAGLIAARRMRSKEQ